MANVLVTGGAGFIGAHVVEHLVRSGHSVLVLDDLSGGVRDNVHSGATFVQGSILDVDLVESLFSTQAFSYVFHLAAYAAEGLSHFIRGFNYSNNLQGSINLINASINFEVKCFVFTSSIAVYGSNTLPMIETAVPLPEDPYGIAKYAVELDLLAAHEMFGLNSVIFRPHNVYGKYQNTADPYRNVIGIFIRQMLEGKPLSIFGDGTQKRAFSHVDDVAPYIANAINHENCYNQTFNIGGDIPYSVLDLATAIGEVFNQKPTIDFLTARNEVKDAWADHSKFQNFFEVKGRERVGLLEGLEEMIKWVKEKGIPESQTFDNIEVNKNLPESWRK